MPTEEQWDQMRGEKQINIQTLACLHDAVAMTIHCGDKNREAIKMWLDILYKIAESKKAELTEPKPLDIKKAVEQGDKWKGNLEEANKNIQNEVEEGRQREHEDKLNFQ